MKICTDCKQIKPLDSFHKLSTRKDGHRSICKQCRSIKSRSEKNKALGRKRNRKYRHTEKGKGNRREYQIEYRTHGDGRAANMRYQQSEKGKITHRNSVYADRARNPIKAKVRGTVGVAVYRGKIPSAKYLKCAKCGDDARHYHHHNGYDREFWLDVIPVCIPCHNSIKYDKPLEVSNETGKSIS